MVRLTTTEAAMSQSDYAGFWAWFRRRSPALTGRGREIVAQLDEHLRARRDLQAMSNEVYLATALVDGVRQGATE
jgi:hypothetical protein